MDRHASSEDGVTSREGPLPGHYLDVRRETGPRATSGSSLWDCSAPARGGVRGDVHGGPHIGEAVGVAAYRGNAAAHGLQLARQGAADAATGTGNESDCGDGGHRSCAQTR
jgi:hypothetical protein